MPIKTHTIIARPNKLPMRTRTIASQTRKSSTLSSTATPPGIQGRGKIIEAGLQLRKDGSQCTNDGH